MPIRVFTPPAPTTPNDGASALRVGLGVLMTGVLGCAGTGVEAGTPNPAAPPTLAPSAVSDAYPMVRIPAGTFTMGSPAAEEGRYDDEQQHEVTLTRAYLMGRTEVTQGLWRSVMGSNPSSQRGDDHPVTDLSWCDAVAFANRLSAREGLPLAYQGVDQCASSEGQSVAWDQSSAGYRLPTEAEWERAARGGAGGPYAGAATEEEACAVGNIADRSAQAKFSGWTTFSCDDGHAGPAPVGRFRANGYGLHDLTGNVWEWCWDGYGAYGVASTDPAGAPSAPYRVRRGGSWSDLPRDARVAIRGGDGPGFRHGGLGLRLVRTIP
jgi:formylglycine-generating enzyme required for sulfatase activity